MYCYHVYTTPGIEDLLAEEILSLVPAADSAAPLPHLPGCATVYTTSPLPPSHFGSLRMATEVVAVRALSTVETLEQDDAETLLAAVGDAVREMPLPELTGGATGPSFAARTVRRGSHAVRSPEVERYVGTVVSRRTGNPVNLAHPDVTIRVDLNGTTIVAGVLHSTRVLDQRFAWVYRPRVTLRTTVAAALVTLATRAGSVTRVLDPFCGSGTIPLECASRGMVTYASDIAPEAVALTRAHAAINGYEAAIMVRRADALELSRVWAGHGIETIICNPPYGIRLGKRMNFDAFYERFLSEAAAILPPGGRLVLMSARRRTQLNRVIQRTAAWTLDHVRMIETGGVFPGIFVLTRQDVDRTGVR